MMPTIRVDEDVIEALSKRIERPFRDTPNDVIRRLLGLDKFNSHDESGRRREKGKFLPMAMYRRAILQVLSHRQDWKASVPTVMGHVGKALAALLTPDDRMPLKSGMIRWENRVMWERLNMVKEGLLKGDSPRGVWELTSKGHDYLKRDGAVDEAAEFRGLRNKRRFEEAKARKLLEQEEEPSED